MLQLADGRAPAKLGQVAALDGLRAIAVGLVMVFHFGVPSGDGGFTGVDIFFALSGFLITTILLGELGSTGTISLARFYRKRVYRLMPSLIALLVAGAILAPLLGSGTLPRTFFKNAAASLLYVNNIGRAIWKDWDNGILGHAWSLSIEEQFYLVWPFALLSMRRWPARRVANAIGVAIGAVMAWRGYLWSRDVWSERIYVATDTRADELLVGCLVALARARGLWPRGAALVRHRAATPVLAAGLAAIVAARPTPEHIALWFPLGIPLISWTSALLVWSIVEQPASRLARLLSLAPLVSIGQVSYELYLFHFPIAGLLLPHSRYLLPNDYVYVIVWTAASFTVAFAVNRFVARPIQRRRSPPGGAVNRSTTLPTLWKHDPSPSSRAPAAASANQRR